MLDLSQRCGSFISAGSKFSARRAIDRSSRNPSQVRGNKEMLGSKTKLLGLCTLALAVMAISAASAQAEKGAFWLVKGAKISESLLPTLGGSQEGTGKLLAKLGANEFHITCTGFAPIGAHLVEPNGSFLGQFEFTGCEFFQLTLKLTVATLLPACKPAGGKITTTELKGLIVLNAGVQAFLLEPKVGSILATIVSSAECAFGKEIKVGEKFAANDCEFAFLTDLMTHLLEEYDPLTVLYINGNPTNVAEIDGSAKVFLTGAHEKMTFAGHS